jgi:hypothetical protein
MDSATVLSGDSLRILGSIIGDTTVVRFQALKTGLAPSAVVTEKYVYLPALPPPTASAPVGNFYDSITVRLKARDGDTIRYTLDNSTPTINSGDGSQAIHLIRSDTIKAVVFHGPQLPSPVASFPYQLRLTAPDFDKPSQQFIDSLVVHITAKSKDTHIVYSLDTADLTMQSSSPLLDGSVTVAWPGVTRLQAFVYLDTLRSATTSAIYERQAVIQQLAEPAMSPRSIEFQDSLNVTLSTTQTDAEIRYTLDGSAPSLASPKYAGAPLVLDTTRIVRARCFPVSGTKSASEPHTEVYTLIPSEPVADSSGAKRYLNSVTVRLSTRTKHGVIKYALGSATAVPNLIYSDSAPIVITASAHLRAQTILVVGGIERPSSTLDVQYEIYKDPVASDTLQPGNSISLTGGYAFSNASNTPVIAKTKIPDKFILVGFKDVSLAVELRSVEPGQPIKVDFTNAGDPLVALYLYANNQVTYITSDNQQMLTAPGDYFLGVDTMPPVITMVSQSPKAGDSTRVVLSVSDNVSNPTCSIVSSGLTARSSFTPNASREATIALKVPGTELKGLWFRAQASDINHDSFLPKDPGGKIYLSQWWSKLNTPSVISLGRGNSPWDLAGFPVGDSLPMSWGAIRAANPDADLDAAVWNENAGTYQYLEDGNIIKPGMALWLGSKKPMNNVVLTAFRTGSSQSPEGGFRMTLHPGWNLVTSPSLDKVYWPVTTAANKAHPVGLKALRSYVPARNDFDRSDSLEPWRGYFVQYSNLENRDTTITLFTARPVPAAAKAGANTVLADADADPRAVDVNLDFGRILPLNLGARGDAQDGAGPEDEPVLPALNNGLKAWSQRGAHRLGSDVVRFAAGELLHWNVVLADSQAASGSGSAGPRIRVLPGILPANYQAWAISSARGMKFRLEEGMEMPVSGLADDTLSIYAGPLGKLSALKEFSQAAAYVGTLAFEVEGNGLQNRILHLQLPWTAEVEASVWSPAGRLLAQSHPGRLNPGIYRLPLNRRNGANEIGILRLRLRAKDRDRELFRKFLW